MPAMCSQGKCGIFCAFASCIDDGGKNRSIIFTEKFFITIFLVIYKLYSSSNFNAISRFFKSSFSRYAKFVRSRGFSGVFFQVLLIDTRISYKFTYVDTSFYFKTLARRHSKFLLYADGLEWYFVTSNSG